MHIWSLVASERVVQVYFDSPSASWQACKNFSGARAPSRLDFVNVEARQQASRQRVPIFGTLVDPRHDTILVTGLVFSLRHPQKLFLEAENVEQLRHLALAMNIYAGIVNVHEHIPSLTNGLPTIMRQLKSLKTFRLGASNDDYQLFDDNAEAGIEDRNYRSLLSRVEDEIELDEVEAEWDEDEAEWDEDEVEWDEDTIHDHYLETYEPDDDLALVLGDRTAESLPRDANGNLTEEARLERTLRHGEEEQFLYMQAMPNYKTRILRFQNLYQQRSFRAFQPVFEQRIETSILEESESNPEWSPPAISVEYLAEYELIDGEEVRVDERRRLRQREEAITDR